MTDYVWGAHKPEEVAGPGRATVTSSPSCPTPPSGMRLDIGRFRGDVTVAASKKAEAAPAVDAGVGTGAVVPAAAPVRRLALALAALALLSGCPGGAHYANCDAVRGASAAPLRDGDPGYSRDLDRDGDGVACDTEGVPS